MKNRLRAVFGFPLVGGGLLLVGMVMIYCIYVQYSGFVP
jgi:hypothetical protein